MKFNLSATKTQKRTFSESLGFALENLRIFDF